MLSQFGHLSTKKKKKKVHVFLVSPSNLTEPVTDTTQVWLDPSHEQDPDNDFYTKMVITF